jgi:hypothetical protein
MITFKELEEQLDEAHKVGDKVLIHKGPADVKGKEGRVSEIRKGLYKGAPKTYTVDYDHHETTGNRKSIQLKPTHFKAVKEDLDEARMTAAMKLQQAFQREQEKTARERKAGEDLLKKNEPKKANEEVVLEAGNKPLEPHVGMGDSRTPRELKTQMTGASNDFVKSTAAKKPGVFHSKVAHMQNKLAKSELRKRTNEEVEQIDEAPKDHTIEAHGIKGMKRTPWRKTFKHEDHLHDWAEKNDADVHGTRELEGAKKSVKEDAACNNVGGGAIAGTQGDAGKKSVAIKMMKRKELKNFKEFVEVLEEGKPGLWANIHAKRKRIKNGSGEKMRTPGSKGAPTAQDFKNSQEQVEAQFDMIEELVEELAIAEGVDSEVVWDRFDSFSDEELLEYAIDKKGHKSSTGGLTQKGVDAYNRKTGGNLKTAVTTPPSKLKPGSKAANRRKSFCARMSGVDGPMKKPNGEPTRKALALRKWNC